MLGKINRNAIEHSFTKFTLQMIQYKWIALLFIFVVTASILSFLPKTTVDTSNEGFLREDDPTLIHYNQFREQFGREEVVIVTLRPKNIFDPVFLEKLKQLHEELEENVPHLDEVTSLVNVRYTTGTEDELIVEDLMEAFPDTPEGYQALEKAVRNHPLYSGFLFSAKHNLTAIVLETQAYSSVGQNDADLMEGFDEPNFDETNTGTSNTTPTQTERPFLTDEESNEMVRSVLDITARYQSDDFPIEVTGSPTLTEFLKGAMQQDMGKFTLLMIATIFVLLLALFRRFSGILLPLIVVILSLLVTIAMMAMLGVPLKLTSQILPSFILAVAIGDSVHILSIFYRRYDETGAKEGAIAYAVGHSGLAVLMTSLTTAAGLMSFSIAELSAVAELGIFGGVGALLALLYSVVLLPILLAIFPIKQKTHHVAPDRNTIVDRILNGASHWAVEHPVKVLTVCGLLLAIAFVGLTKVQLKHDVMTWLPKENPVRVSMDKLDRELNGSVSFEVVVDSGKPEGLYNPEFMQRLATLQERFNIFESEFGTIQAGKKLSVVDILRETNQALNGNDPAFYSIPQKRDLLAQELFLFENSGSDDLEDFVDSELRKARLTVRLPWVDAGSYQQIIGQIHAQVDEVFAGYAQTHVTGLVAVFGRTMGAMLTSMAQSYTIAVFVITAMMIVLIGQIRMGLISMLPNLFPIILVLGIAGWMSIPLDAFTMLIGGIALGLAVDDTVHFMHNFHRYHAQSGSTVKAIEQTFHTAGRAMVVTTIALSAGFFIFMSSTLNNLWNFGWLTGLAIVLALVADLLLAPALMVLIHGKHPKIPTQTV